MATEWRVFNGLLAHAMGRRYPSEQRDRPICGANRYTWHGGRPLTKRCIRCIRCLRVLGMKTPRPLRQRVELLNAELRLLHMKIRRSA